MEPKDMTTGQMCKATVVSVEDGKVLVETDTMQSIYLDLLRESKFLEKQGIDAAGLLSPGHQLDVMVDSTAGGNYAGSLESAFRNKIKADLHQAMAEQKSAYKVRIKAINQGGFIVDLAGLECFMPGSLAAANRVTDFESMLGKEIYVMVENYLEGSDMFVVSNKKYIQWIMPHRVKDLEFSTQYTGTVTGVMKYGAFIEWDEIFTGLLHESEVSDCDLKSLKAGDPVTFWVREVRENKDTKEIRIILSQRGPSPEAMLYQEFKDSWEGKNFPNACVKDVKQFGIFVEMDKVVGMIVPREFKKTGARAFAGEYLDVHVKQVDVAAKKIYLRAAEDDETVSIRSDDGREWTI